MIQGGYVRHVGLSEAGPTPSAALTPRTGADLQIEYSLLSRGIEAEILPVCRSLPGIDAGFEAVRSLVLRGLGTQVR